METSNEKKSITMHQGIGEDAMEIKVQVTQEELEKMEQLRGLGPEKWEGKDLELLQEARKLIKQQKEINEVKQSSTEEVVKPVAFEEKKKKGNPGLWWAIGILAVFVITMKIIAGTLEKRNRETFQQIIKNNPEVVDQVLGQTITHHGITLKYPQNWSLEANDISDTQFLIAGSNEDDSEFSVFWTTNKEIPVEDYINNIISGYSTSSNCTDLEFGALYETKVNGMDAVAVDYSCKYQGVMTWAQLIGFENDEYKVVLNLIARSENALKTDFTVMTNSIRFTNKSRYSN